VALLPQSRLSRLKLALAACAALSTALAGCEQRGPRASAAPSAKASVAPPSRPPDPATPRLLLEIPGSAYAAALVLDGTRPGLLTPNALYDLEGRPPQRVGFETGELGALVGGDVVRWANGGLRRRRGDSDTWLAFAQPPVPPQRMAAWREDLAWVQTDSGTGVSLWTSRGAEPRRLASAPGGIATLTVRDDQVFFVEELAPSRWRLGAVPLSGGSARYAPPQSGRAPALLVVTSDIFYYDGPTLSVYRVSTDLLRVERLGQDVVCSPLAVADSVYCSQPGGILALPLSGGEPRLVTSTRGTVTAMAATASELLWIRESSSAELAVEVLAL
jgi:hypothetical protein